MTERQFLVDINPNIDLPEYNLVLYSLYEQPITELYNITNFNIKPFFIGIDEMSFNIPMTRNEADGQIVRNEIYDMVDGEYYIKLNDSKFFVINKINEKINDDGFTYKEVSAYSREAELNQKRLVNYRASSRMLYDRENTMLEDENGQLIERGVLNYIFNHITNAWVIGTVDERVVSLTNQGISRELNFSNSSLIQVFQELQKTYNCVFKFNTITQVIDVDSSLNYDLNIGDIANSPQYKGLYISDENFIKNMSKNIEYDKVKTRLFLYGKDNVSIQNIHPTGQPHIDNLSTFKTTKFMTQELIDSLNAYELLVQNANPNFTPLLNQLQTKNTELEDLYNKDDAIIANKGLVALKRELSLVQTNIDTKVANLAIIRETIAGANGTDLSELHTQMKTIQTEIDGFESQKTIINSLITTKEGQITSKKSEIVSVENQIQGIRDSLSIQANLEPHLVKELDKFIRVEIYNDSNFTENNIMELYEEGKKNLAKISQPSIQFDVNVVDFLSIVECQHTWDKLVLGDIVLLENKNIGFSYYVRLVGYEHSPDNNSLRLYFSNTNSFDDATLWIKDLLEQMSNTTSTLDFNKYKWDKTEDMQDRISKMVDEKLEEARQNILNAVGQRHLFDDSGLWLYKENPDGTLDDAQIRAINSDIVLTDDNFATVKTAISAKDGINAEVIRGKLGQFAIVTADQIEVGGGENPPNLNDELARREQETQDKIDLVNREIVDVDGKISGLEDFTNIAFKDGILNMAEKESLLVHIQQLNNEKSDVDAKYTSIYADVNLIETPKSSLLTAKNNYNISHSSLITTINNTASDNKITESEKTLINNAFIDYREKLSALSIAFENAVRAIESKKSESIANDLIVNFNTNTLVPAISGVQTQIDGKIDTWFYAVEPTLLNPPANNWATNVIKDKHIDDLYYDTVKGYAYRFAKVGTVYSWQRIMDSDITKALSDANNAKAAADGKMTVFITQPITPYHKGDLWRETANATDLKICTTERLTGAYVASDWSNATNVGGALSTLSGQIGDFSSDLKLTLAEANSLKMSLESVTSESTELITTATSLGITTEKTSYSTSLTTLTNYLNINWLGKAYPLTITVAQRTNVTNYFKDLENKKSILLTKITEVREERANSYTDGEINTTKTEFKVTTDAISSKVTGIETDTSGLKTRMSSAENKITPNAITSTVESNTTKLATNSSVDSKINSAKSSVEQYADGIVSAVRSTANSAQSTANTANSKATTAITNASSAKQTADSVTLDFSQFKTLASGQTLGGGTGRTTIDRDGVKVTHTGLGGQYSEIRADGFVRKWQYGEAEYLNGIYVRKFYEDGDKLDVVEGTNIYPPDPYKVYLPDSFKGREDLLIIPVPLQWDFYHGNSARDGTLSRFVRRTYVTCNIAIEPGTRLNPVELKDLNPSSGKPWVKVNVYKEENFDTSTSDDDDRYRGIDWMLLVIGE